MNSLIRTITSARIDTMYDAVLRFTGDAVYAVADKKKAAIANNIASSNRDRQKQPRRQQQQQQQ